MKEQKDLFSRHAHSVVLGRNNHAQSRNSIQFYYNWSSKSIQPTYSSINRKVQQS